MSFKPDMPEPKAASSQHWSTDPACWRSYCEDLVYAASSLRMAGQAYAGQIARRRRLEPEQRAAAIRHGEAMHAELLALCPEAPTGLALAQRAWGDEPGMAATQRRQAQYATLASCARWLPKPPASAQQRDLAERARRSGITEDERQRNAEALAAEMGS